MAPELVALTTTPQRLRAAAMLRELTADFLSHEADDDALRDLGDALAQASRRLGGFERRERSFEEIVQEPLAPEVEDGQAMDHFDHCFLTGAASPIGLAALVRRDGDDVVATVSIPVTFEGMPGHAHGGILLAIFDDLIGMVMGRLNRIPAPTVRVEVSFRAPVPLDSQIEFRARLAHREGRKVTVTATATVGGVNHAESTGLLIILNEDQRFDRSAGGADGKA